MQINHSEFGIVEVTPNARARRFIFRVDAHGTLRVTTPARFKEQDLLKAIDSLKPKLQRLKEKRKDIKLIDEKFSINLPDFRMALRMGNVPNMQARMSKGTLDVVYPQGTDFTQADVQKWLVYVTEEAIRHQAKLILPARLMQFAQKLNLHVDAIKIHKTHSRWGSCSTTRHINLSLYLILLPRHLQDYVMLHELTHLIHMNHSPQFWAQLDAFCGCSSQALCQEMSAYDTSIFAKRLS